MSIRAPWTWMGETPHLGMPRSASGRMEPDSPILPAAAGSLPASSPLREGHGRASDGRIPALRGDAEALDGLPVGERVVRRLEAELEPPSRQGIAAKGAEPRVRMAPQSATPNPDTFDPVSGSCRAHGGGAASNVPLTQEPANRFKTG